MSNDQEVGLIKPWMYRVPGENIAFLVTIVILFGISLILSWVNVYLFSLLFIGGIIYVRLSQARYKGDAIRVHGQQFEEIYSMFIDSAKKLGIERAALYINQDPYLQAFTIGITSCTIVLTSALVEQMTKKELAFVIAHELGHYRAGHTKFSTLFVPLGNGTITNLIFGFWGRKTEYSSDRCGLIMTKDIDSAISSLLKLSLGGKLYDQLNIKGYLAQLKDARDGYVRTGEMLGDHPLISNRIINALMFWKEQFVSKT